MPKVATRIVEPKKRRRGKARVIKTPETDETPAPKRSLRGPRVRIILGGSMAPIQEACENTKSTSMKLKTMMKNKTSKAKSTTIKNGLLTGENISQSISRKKPNKSVSDILRKAGVRISVVVTSVDTKSTDTKITALLKNFGKSVRSETKELEKISSKQRKHSLKITKAATTGKLRA